MISEETAIKMESQQKEEGEAFLLHRDRNRRQYTGARNHSHVSLNSRFALQQKWHPDSGSSLGARSTPQDDQRGFGSPQQQTHFTPNQRSGVSNSYTPRYRNRGPERPRSNKCNLCGLSGHFERECKLRSILDRMKDFEHRLLK